MSQKYTSPPPGTVHPWVLEHEETVLEGRYLRILRQRVTTGRGVTIPDYHIIDSPSWAAAVCLTPKQELVLVRQYRHGHEGASLELPAGIIEPGEAPLAAAVRELYEETGYEAETAEPLWSIRPEPARHRQWAHMAFVRSSANPRDAEPEETEDVTVELWPAAQLDAIVAQMVHAVHVGALLLAARRGLLGGT
jgi:8-oxo-dGTP pyrophosphatase MutT (NUDIX family)